MDAAVGSLGEGAQGDAGFGGVDGALEQLIGEARAATDQERQGRLLGAEHLLSGHGDSLLVGGDLLLLAPPDGEGVGGPPADGGDVQVEVLTGLERPGARHVQGDAQSITGEGLDEGCRGRSADVAIQNHEDTGGALEGPEDDGGEQVRLRHQSVQVDPQEAERDGHHGDVEVEEGFVESMADGGGGVHHERDKRTAGLSGVSFLHFQSRTNEFNTYNQATEEKRALAEDHADNFPTDYQNDQHRDS